MFQQNGLSLDQAPPILVVFRLFLMASIFGIFAGLEILYYQNDIFNPSSTGAITLTHTLTLGVMASFMLGALFQMLPVIAGVVLDSPLKRSLLIQIPFFFGIVSLLLAFNLSEINFLYPLASILLLSSLFGAIFIMLYRLLKVSNHSPSSRGMVISLILFGVTIMLALYMISSLMGYIDGVYYLEIKNLHIHFGLFGWIGLLIFSIAFQVIEMFFVTPKYPNVARDYFAYLILALLITSSIYPIVNIALYISIIAFAILTLYRLSQKKRPLSDATIWFWRLGLVSIILAMALSIIYIYTPQLIILNTISILFTSFALSVVFSMFYKIVPFLTWFHLNSQGYFTAPMMHEVIHPKTAKKHFWIHLSSIISLIISIFIPNIIFLSGVLVSISFIWVSYQIIYAYRLYIKTQKSGEKFDFNVAG